MSKKYVSIALAVILMFPTLIAHAADQEQSGITRGDFFNLVVNHLQLSVKEDKASLPEDVEESSPYKDSIRVLTEQGVLNGYLDGTIRGGTVLTNQQASFVLGRLLGVEDEEAAAFLKNEYGISLNNKESVSVEEAKNAVKQVLTSDPEAVKLVRQSSQKQADLTSFRSDIEQLVSMKLKEDAEVTTPPPSEMSMTSVMEYHKEKGIHQSITMQLPEPLPNGDQEMKMEQYMVPEGMYMKSKDPKTGESKWVHMGKEFPLSFEQIAQMQQKSLQLNESLIDKNFFYRFEGEEEVDGKMLQKVSFNGRLTSLEEILKMMKEMMPDSAQDTQMMDDLTQSFLAEALYSGTMWIDAETNLPTKVRMIAQLKYGDNAKIPFESMTTSMNATYYDYNQVDDIVLPEEAKNAEEIPFPPTDEDTQFSNDDDTQTSEDDDSN